MSIEGPSTDRVLASIRVNRKGISDSYQRFMVDRRIAPTNRDAPMNLFESPKVSIAMPADILISLASSISLNWNPGRAISEYMPESGVVYGYTPEGHLRFVSAWWRANNEWHSMLLRVNNEGKSTADYAPFHGLPYIGFFLGLASTKLKDFTTEAVDEDDMKLAMIRYHVPESVRQEEVDQLERFKLSPRVLPSYMNTLRRARNTRRHIEDSVWWISEDLSALVWDTVLSGTMPDDILDEEVPGDIGMMFFDGGEGLPLPCVPLYGSDSGEVVYTTINAVVWDHAYDRNAVLIDDDAKSRLNFYPVAAKTRPFVAYPDNSSESLIIDPLGAADWSLEHIVGFSQSAVNDLSEKLVKTALRLSREEFVGERQTTSIEPLSKAARKKAERTGKKPDMVVLATLRRPKNQKPEELRDAHGREFSHRWIVRGHTRKQPFGKINEEGKRQVKNVWIAPYVKGPADKPLVIKDKVMVWKR